VGARNCPDHRPKRANAPAASPEVIKERGGKTILLISAASFEQKEKRGKRGYVAFACGDLMLPLPIESAVRAKKRGGEEARRFLIE